MRFRRSGAFSVPSWPHNFRVALLGFFVAGMLVAIVGAVSLQLPDAIPEDVREDAIAGGVARGRYLAELEARQSAMEAAPRLAEDEVEAQLSDGDADDSYRRAYEYAWNDAVNTLARRVPRQLLAAEEHTQWIELLR